MVGKGIHEVLKFFNKPNVHLGMVEKQLKGLRKGGYTYGAMLVWQMVFVLFMSSGLCLCSFKPIRVEPCREVVQAPSLGKLLIMVRHKQFQASWGRQKIHRRCWLEAHAKPLQDGKGELWETSQKMKRPSQGQEENTENLLSDLGSHWVGWKQSAACKERGNMG